MNNLRKDDPVYYKNSIKALIKQAEENGLIISIGFNENNINLNFKAENGDVASVKLLRMRNRE